ncbi:MAG: SAP domain-containing protein [Actinobacteria bacterium]|nr:SAP domain-containing protein [Actinomycetota bacterium]
MPTVQELVDDNSKAELVELAEEYELSTDGNKSDIAERIFKFETGVPATAEVSEPELEPEPEEVDEAELTLLRYAGKALIYETHGYRFGRETPFRLVKDEVAEKLFESAPKLFRPASKKEVENFYS